MPRPRVPEVPQRQSPGGSLQLRISSSDSDSSHHRPITHQSPKLGDRRSPRGPQPDCVSQKKLGTRIADLESQLGQAQEELKSLKEQLASAEAAKKEAQEQLQKKAKKKPISENQKRRPRKNSTSRNDNVTDDETYQKKNVTDDENRQETDVFEVSVEKEALNTQIEASHSIRETEKQIGAMEMLTEPPVFVEPEKEPFNELTAKDDEINLLKSGLEAKDLELEAAGLEKYSMKTKLDEVNDMLALARIKEKEASTRLTQMAEEIRTSKEDNLGLKSKLEAVEGEKEALEAEMKKLRVQTEQWKKAADAAAAVLAGEVDMDGRVPGRCRSMDKQFNGVFEMSSAGYAGYVGSPGNADNIDDGYGGGGRRKNSGIRMFGDLWKKKPQK